MHTMCVACQAWNACVLCHVHFMSALNVWGLMRCGLFVYIWKSDAMQLFLFGSKCKRHSCIHFLCVHTSRCRLLRCMQLVSHAGCTICCCFVCIYRRCTQQWQSAQIVGCFASPLSTVKSVRVGMFEKWAWGGWACGVPLNVRTSIEVCAVWECCTYVAIAKRKQCVRCPTMTSLYCLGIPIMVGTIGFGVWLGTICE